MITLSPGQLPSMFNKTIWGPFHWPWPSSNPRAFCTAPEMQKALLEKDDYCLPVKAISWSDRAESWAEIINTYQQQSWLILNNRSLLRAASQSHTRSVGFEEQHNLIPIVQRVATNTSDTRLDKTRRDTSQGNDWWTFNSSPLSQDCSLACLADTTSHQYY